MNRHVFAIVGRLSRYHWYQQDELDGRIHKLCPSCLPLQLLCWVGELDIKDAK